MLNVYALKCMSELIGLQVPYDQNILELEKVVDRSQTCAHSASH